MKLSNWAQMYCRRPFCSSDIQQQLAYTNPSDKLTQSINTEHDNKFFMHNLDEVKEQNLKKSSVIKSTNILYFLMIHHLVIACAIATPSSIGKTYKNNWNHYFTYNSEVIDNIDITNPTIPDSNIKSRRAQPHSEQNSSAALPLNLLLYRKNIDEHLCCEAKVRDEYPSNSRSKRSSAPLRTHSFETNYDKLLNHEHGLEQTQPAQGLLRNYETNTEFIEPSSGNYEVPQEEYDTLKSNSPQTLSNEPIAPTSAVIDSNALNKESDTYYDERTYNKAPQLIRRIPKLIVTAGRFWKYYVPYDIFIDEDGDLRNLKSSIMTKPYFSLFKEGSSNQNASNAIDKNQEQLIEQDQPLSWDKWMQYDESKLMMYAFATEKDVGRHAFSLVVKDKWDKIAQEKIEIVVRQHSSSRALSHSFTLASNEWKFTGYRSVVDLFEYFSKTISSLMSDSSHNLIVESYEFSSVESQLSKDTHPTYLESLPNNNISFKVTWSNESVPIHPCNLDSIEQMLNQLIDPKMLPSPWSIEVGNSLKLTPSENLTSLLGQTIVPSSISYNLQGSCELPDSSNQLNSYENSIKVKTRIGKLNYKLGQPFRYAIPDDIFSDDNSMFSTKDLSLTIHTIDGLPLNLQSGYDYLEFDKENQVLYGMPFDALSHIGERELQLTAKHPVSNKRVREVFIVEVEGLIFSSLDSRLFMMSLYVIPRLGYFRPIERFALATKILEAFQRKTDDANYRNSDLVVIGIQKFAVSNYFRKNSKLAEIFNSKEDNGKKFVKIAEKNEHKEAKIFLDDETIRADPFDEFMNSADGDEVDQERFAQPNFFYKFSWTNESIANNNECPVESIKQNILYSLERSMLSVDSSRAVTSNQVSKNDSEKFYEKLKFFFEPDVDLIHLRFEPLGLCVSSIEQHDVGNSDIADLADSAVELTSPSVRETKSDKLRNSSFSYIGSAIDLGEDYLTLIVLFVLMISLVGVVTLFFLGIHTYRLNQEKNFELQVRLVQARQNSMYLSSMMLANQTPQIVGNDIHSNTLIVPNPMNNPPVNLYDDSKDLLGKQSLDDGGFGQKNEPKFGLISPQHVTTLMNGNGIQTLPMKQSMTMSLDGMMSTPANSWQPAPYWVGPINLEEAQRSRTLRNRGTDRSMMPSSIQHSSYNLRQSTGLMDPQIVGSPMHYVQTTPLLYQPLPSLNSTQFSLAPMQMTAMNQPLQFGTNSNGLVAPAIPPKPMSSVQQYPATTTMSQIEESFTEINSPKVFSNRVTLSSSSTNSSNTTTMNPGSSRNML